MTQRIHCKMSLRLHQEVFSFLFKRENKEFLIKDKNWSWQEKHIKMNKALQGFEIRPFYIELCIMKYKKPPKTLQYFWRKPVGETLLFFNYTWGSSFLSKCLPTVKIAILIFKAFTFVESEKECSSLLSDKGIRGALVEYKVRSLGGRVV